ncbi:universal stress protein [Rhodococcus hoagii]|nr:universal stress protein [Prescottella equi]
MHGCGGARRRRQPRPPTSGPVVAGVDHSDSADIVVGTAMQEASIRHAEMTAVHARRRRGTQEPTRRPRPHRSADRDPGRQVPVGAGRNRDRGGGPTKHLVALSATARSIVVGSRGRGGFESALLGSTCQSLLYHAQCPVIVARSRVTP